LRTNGVSISGGNASLFKKQKPPRESSGDGLQNKKPLKPVGER